MGCLAETFIKKAKGYKWGKQVKKVKYSNDAPNGYGFVGLNLEKPIFKTKNVRLALCSLVKQRVNDLRNLDMEWIFLRQVPGISNQFMQTKV